MIEVILTEKEKSDYVAQHAACECAGCVDDINTLGDKQFHSAHTEDNGDLCVMLKCVVCEDLFCASEHEH